MRVSCVPYFLLVFRYLSLSALAWLRLSIRIFFPSIWAGFVYAESNILECFIRLGYAFTNAIDLFLTSSPVCRWKIIKAVFDVPYR
jgi:hypothetical protein